MILKRTLESFPLPKFIPSPILSGKLLPQENLAMLEKQELSVLVMSAFIENKAHPENVKF
ncbi:MAG TPA: hypothetical protein DET40_08455 [Lentisphaeria bacterium]|nr:MAG: hypothetical protein A2X45_12055 [Lentisphaerae bacterium GWF2_50_93]HCE43565.1 hypothetical protein [Lentisphaeria bacterium]